MSQQLSFQSVTNDVTPSRRRKWTEAHRSTLFDIFIDLKNEGRQSDTGGFRQADFEEAAQRLRVKAPDLTIDIKQLRSRFDDSRRLWRAWTTHLQWISGWGTNNDDVPINDTDIEDEYFKQHPDMKAFRRKAPVLRKKLEVLFGSGLATGENSVGAWDTLSRLRQARTEKQAATQADMDIDVIDQQEQAETPATMAQSPDPSNLPSDGNLSPATPPRPATSDVKPTPRRHTKQAQDQYSVAKANIQSTEELRSMKSRAEMALLRIKNHPLTAQLDAAQRIQFRKAFMDKYSVADVLVMDDDELQYTISDLLNTCFPVFDTGLAPARGG